VIDLHAHILPGLDDGAASWDESLALARAFAREGTLLVAATPHVRADYPTEPAAMEAALADLGRALATQGIDLRLRGGGEIALDRLRRLSAGDLRRFGLAGNPDYLLLEFPYSGWPLALGDLVLELRAEGITPVLAHPERNPAVQETPARLAPLVEAGALVQVTAASLDGRLGRAARRAGLALVQLGLAHLVASDAHGGGLREAGLSAAARAVGDAGLADWLTYGVPYAIVTGAPLPRRPSPPPQRSWRRG
jgi:protein-tyrosine phosphatase